MANKKDEAGGGAAPGDRPAQSATPAATPAETGGGPHRTQRMADEASRTMESGRQAMEQASQQATELGRQSAEQTARIADRAIRQTAELARSRQEEAHNLLGMSTSAYRDITEHSRADFDAMMQSSARLARGLQEMGWEMTHFTQKSMRLSMQLANDLLECRTVEDVIARQRDYVKETVDALIAESARLLHLSSRIANDAVSPISDRVGDGAADPDERPVIPRSKEGAGRETRPH